MPGKADIKAGSAYVELLLKDSAFVKGLRSAGTKLKNFGTGVAGIGASITAAGAAITAPLAAMVNQFLAAGDELDKMRQRTGISVEALSELNDREKEVVRLRCGLDAGQARTLEEVGKEFGVTRERIRQIEAKTLAKLRHPQRSQRLREFLEVE